ncbi:MAG: hypothetical protein AAF653_19825 [Chloroflexota bacterium]
MTRVDEKPFGTLFDTVTRLQAGFPCRGQFFSLLLVTDVQFADRMMVIITHTGKAHRRLLPPQTFVVE